MKKIIILFLFVAGFISCSSDRISPSGVIVTESRLAQDFSSLEVSSGIRATVTMGETESLEIEADDNVIDEIKTSVSNGVLKVEMGNVSFRKAPTIRVAISARSLNAVSGSGGAGIVFTNAVTADRFALLLSGGSRSEGSVSVDRFDADLSGGSRADYGGTAATLNLTGTGGSSSSGYGLTVQEAVIDLSGGSTAEHTINGTIRGRLSGGSILRYKGTAVIQTLESDGGSEVLHVP